MRTLRTLGGLWLDTGNGRVEGRGGQRRRLALLAVVALSPNRRVTRDKALAILWPEASSVEGRRRLSTAIYDLRAAFGDGVLESGGDELWIGDDAAWSTDVKRFESAWFAGDTETAIAAYTGEFLDGVHLSQAPEFDEWVGVHRERLRRLHLEVIERAAQERLERGDHRGAIAAASLLGELDPLSGRVAMNAAAVLSACGDRTRAMRLLTTHADRLKTELGTEPDPAIGRLLQELRGVPPGSTPQSAVVASPRVSVTAPTRIESDRAQPSAESTPRSQRRPRARRWAAITALGILVSALAGAHFARTPTRPADSAAGMFVDPVQIEGNVSPELGRRIAELFAAALQEIGFTNDESRIATDGTAPTRVVRVSDTANQAVRLTAMLRDSRSGARLAAAEVRGSADSLSAIVTSLARGLAADGFANEGRGLLASATRSAKSLSALNAFVAGERAYREGRYDAAVTSFQTSVALDSAFAIGHYRLALSSLWQENPTFLTSLHDSLAVRYSAGLAPNDRLLIRAYAAWRRGAFRTADSLYQTAWTQDRQNAEVQFQHGEVLFHYNPLRGRSVSEARAWFEGALAIDTANWGARWHLMLLDARTSSERELQAQVTALSRSNPGSVTALEMRLFAADSSALDVARQADSASSIVLFDAAWRRAVFRSDLDGAEWLLSRLAQRASGSDRSAGISALGALWFGQGRFRQAISILGREPRRIADAPRWVVLVEGVLANSIAHPSIVDSLPAEIEHWRETFGSFDRKLSTANQTALYLTDLLAVSRGDAAEADRLSEELERIPGWPQDPYMPRDAPPSKELARVVRAFRAWRENRCEVALRELDQETQPRWLGLVASSPVEAQSLERFVRAQCLLSLGRNREAIAWFETFDQNTLFDFAFLGPALRGQIQAHLALGETDAAHAVQARLARLWAHADPDAAAALATSASSDARR